MSADGRFVAFASQASNLVPGDTNGKPDVFVRDRRTGTIERVSVATDGTQGDSDSDYASISADGRYVLFESFATNLVPGDSNGQTDVYVHDRRTGTTRCVSVDSRGMPSNNYSFWPSFSADGRHVAFASASWNLVRGDTNGYEDIFVHDIGSGATERVSLSSDGTQGDRQCGASGLSSDGRYVVFESSASTLVSGDTNGRWDIFVRDRQAAITERVSVSSDGGQGRLDSYLYPSISSDGRYVAFSSEADDLVPGDTNGCLDGFLHDRLTGATIRASVGAGGAQGNDWSTASGLSEDGQYVAFWSGASNLVAGDTNDAVDVFVRDLLGRTTERVSVSSSGAQGNLYSAFPGITANARWVAFVSYSGTLVSNDSNGTEDVFVRDRSGEPSFTSLCDAGISGVIPCPCGNPPFGVGHGCDNSSGTGGARLSASGGCYLSSDSLVFGTTGEPPSALSILLQGKALLPQGRAYGQGLRCIDGTPLRLYVKHASMGSIEVPSFDMGVDPTVSVRSAEKGDVIHAGESRWYLVYYRDRTILGGCSATSTFNATQTGRVDWSP